MQDSQSVTPQHSKQDSKQASPLLSAEVLSDFPPLPPRKAKPGDYTDEERYAIVEWICAHVAEGGEGNTFRHWAKEAGISRATLWKWTSDDKKLAGIWESGRIWQAHSSVEDMLDLADSATGGKGGNVDKVRLQVDARKFFIVKVAPKIYGDKLELAGANGIPLIPPAPTRVDLSRLSFAELLQLESIVGRATVSNVLPATDGAQAALPAGPSVTDGA